MWKILGGILVNIFLGRFQGQKPLGPAAPWVFGLGTPQGQYSPGYPPVFSTYCIKQKYWTFHRLKKLLFRGTQEKVKLQKFFFVKAYSANSQIDAENLLYKSVMAGRQIGPAIQGWEIEYSHQTTARNMGCWYNMVVSTIVKHMY